ncbi:hypothetical protein CVT25_005594 [Psilocybe cyanescens]|uniref:Uncharacterized protein n=1 Tax=Psilocybe cyanescens TaxID=93625 RepID=A0A409W5B7_PSICY|nr:hypothetical protein CVT25_005594 [Psilocybe cyanescens]
MGGGSRYPYPKYVWSPAGGWWVRPSNWASNTAVAVLGIVVVSATVWSASARLEKRTVQPDRWIPSMLWAKEFTDKKDTTTETH